MKNLNHYTNFSTIVKGATSHSDNMNHIIHSKLDEGMKQKALEEGKGIVKKILLLVLFDVLFIVLAIVVSSCSFMDITDGEIFILIFPICIGLVSCLIAIIGAILIMKSCPTYYKAVDLIRKGWDGLSETEIKELALNPEELKLLKAYKRHGLLWGIIWIVLLVYMIVTFNNIRLIRIEEGVGFLTLIVFVVLTIPCWIKIQTNEEIINEIESGMFDRNLSKPSFLKSKKTLIYILIIILLTSWIGANFDFRTEEEKRWDNIRELLNTDNIENTKDKMDRVNQNLDKLNNGQNSYEDDLEDVREATSNIYDILKELDNTEQD